MAITNSTQVNFIQVATLQAYNQIVTKDPGTVYFIVDVKKIAVDGVLYGFNSSDVDLTPYLEKAGGTMTGILNMNNNIQFSNDPFRFIRGNLLTSGQEKVIQLASPDGIDITGVESEIGLRLNLKRIGTVGDPTYPNDASNKKYVDNKISEINDKQGSPNGIATLDGTGKVPSGQLPSYVDDVLEYATKTAFPTTGESGKIYTALDTNIIYRWGGSAYIEISSSLALGETASTAYRGDRGKAAYDHSQITHGNPHGVTGAQVGLGNVLNYGLATEAEAKAGTVSTKYMTPLRTKQAIETLAPKLTWTVVS